MLKSVKFRSFLRTRGEKSLLNAARKGDKAALHRLYQESFFSVYAAAVAQVGERSLAEELTSEAFLRFWLSLSSSHGETDVRSWLLTIVRDLVIERRHRQRNVGPIPPGAPEFTDPQDHGPPPDPLRPGAPVLQAWEYELIWKTFEELSEEHQTLLRLRYVQEWPYERIAEALSIPVGMVKSRMYRGLSALFRQLD